jgi:hypothetical protein
MVLLSIITNQDVFMATMQDISKLRSDHAIDLRDWDLSPSVGLIDALDLRSGIPDSLDDFFEVMPTYAADSTLVPSQSAINAADVAEYNVDRSRFLIILGIVLTVVALGLLTLAIAAAAHIIAL